MPAIRIMVRNIIVTKLVAITTKICFLANCLYSNLGSFMKHMIKVINNPSKLLLTNIMVIHNYFTIMKHYFTLMFVASKLLVESAATIIVTGATAVTIIPYLSLISSFTGH